MLHTSVGMSPTWSACRWVRNTFVVAVTGRCRPLKFASEPEPRSKKKKSRSGLPTSISTDADPCALLVNGSPLPRIVTRISPSPTRSRSGNTVGANSRLGVPTTGIDVNGLALPSNASSVISVISVLILESSPVGRPVALAWPSHEPSSDSSRSGIHQKA